MIIRDINEAKVDLATLIEAAREGNVVILAEAGKPVAKLVAYDQAGDVRTPGSMAGEIWIAPDFDSLHVETEEAFGIRKSGA